MNEEAKLPRTHSSPEAALLLVSTKKSRPLAPLAMSNTGSPQFTDFPSLCACSESSLTNLIGSGLNLLCFQSHSKTECRWTGPEVAILGADQKERGLWERECHAPRAKKKERKNLSSAQASLSPQALLGVVSPGTLVSVFALYAYGCFTGFFLTVFPLALYFCLPIRQYVGFRQ